jgi:hypothetical protein
MNFATDTLPLMALMTTVGGLTQGKALAPITFAPPGIDVDQ